LPPTSAIRTEELVNYFPFEYDQPETEHPIAVNGEISTCPWNTEHKLLRIGIQGRDIPAANLPATNYVFLIDVSGSMRRPDGVLLVLSIHPIL
jgi:Ca-activated chloride channel family protein